MLAQLLMLLAAVACSASISYDQKSFMIDGKRTLLIGGSFHYPRTTPSEWPTVMSEMKANGINLLQTYVFWDLHEPTEGVYNFPSDPLDEANLVLFLQEAKKAGLYVHLRIGPYSCAEWSNGGLPAWLLANDGSTWRTDDELWLKRIFSFADKTLQVVTDANLLHDKGGAIIMAQIENEYGNIESFYGAGGESYVAKVAEYAISKTNLDIPWVMCRQGEGTGTAPPAEVINACNGYYCDNWIEQHAADFPTQPHMFTENWPGWFQKWGEAMPHRPASDVAFSVARWFAKGGSFMNYYMAFGGTSFARHVGGPNIITSYDYDVMINEYGYRAEPKFSLTTGLHETLYEIQDVMFATPSVVAALFNNSQSCETQTYFDEDTKECVLFLSNIGTNGDECQLGEFKIPAWSVSIVKGAIDKESGDCNGAKLMYSTKGLEKLATRVLAFSEVESAPIKIEKTGVEFVPAFGSQDSDKPLEQISVTRDKTDYLWYTTVVESNGGSASIAFDASVNGGVCYYLYVNGLKSAEQCGQVIYDDFKAQKVSWEDVAFKAGTNEVAILSVAMGLRNYGVSMETNQAGISGDVMVDGEVVTGWRHVAGLTGEDSGEGEDEDFGWFSLKFTVGEAEGPLALDLGSAGKGMAFVNGKMLGRFWDLKSGVGGCGACDEMTYAGGFEAESCRTGCGEMSQRYYKLPRDWLVGGGEEQEVVLFVERAGEGGVEGVRLMEVGME